MLTRKVIWGTACHWGKFLSLGVPKRACHTATLIFSVCLLGVPHSIDDGHHNEWGIRLFTNPSWTQVPNWITSIKVNPDMTFLTSGFILSQCHRARRKLYIPRQDIPRDVLFSFPTQLKCNTLQQLWPEPKAELRGLNWEKFKSCNSVSWGRN